jgi:hypothetical protein
MCLETTERIERIAENDVVCYKMLRMLDDGRFVTPFAGKKVSSKVLSGKRIFKPSFFSIKDIRNVGCFKEIRRGYIHVYNSPYKVVLFSNEKLFKCIIPKGTRYWCDKFNGEYAARKIRFVEEIQKKVYNLA